jgi:hypothetical protein
LSTPTLPNSGPRLPYPYRLNGDRISIPLMKDLGWQELGILPVRSGKVWVGDAQFAASEGDGEVVELAPGNYEGRIRRLNFDGDIRVSHLQLVQVGAVPQRGAQIGETWADTASQGVCDFEIYRLVSADYEPYWEQSEAALTSGEPGRYVHDAEREAVLIHTESGWGDGTFKLFELIDDGRRVGIEVEMIDPDDPFPDD